MNERFHFLVITKFTKQRSIFKTGHIFGSAILLDLIVTDGPVRIGMDYNTLSDYGSKCRDDTKIYLNRDQYIKLCDTNFFETPVYNIARLSDKDLAKEMFMFKI